MLRKGVLELILLQAELLELKANPNKPARKANQRSQLAPENQRAKSAEFLTASRMVIAPAPSR